MRRVLFAWRGFEISSYWAMLYLGLVAGLGAGNLAAHRAGIDAGAVYLAQLVLIPFALLGARLMYVSFHWRRYRSAPRRILRASEGGADMFGGLPVAMALSGPLLDGLGLSYWPFWDVTAFTILTGMGITRVGCLLNGCCAGRPTGDVWGLTLPDHEGRACRRVPTQLLEAGLAAVGLAIATAAAGRPGGAGTIFCLAVAVYSAGRVALDPTRAHRRPWIGPVTIHQAIYGATLTLGLLGLWLLRDQA